MYYYYNFPNHLLTGMVSDLDKGILIQFGKRLKYLRQSKNLTYRKMALLCNVEYADIQRYETGKVNITLLSLGELAKALEVDPQELLNFKETLPDLKT
ncbi:helix-turn-helix domain-containing protein [Mucilaginibacter paludis]|nr:helix-turn-helix transcriptional regulator [Mucilaginibacter paludis]